MSALLALCALGACSPPGKPAYQGYVEGEFVHVASGVAGRLERLRVQRGESVAAKAPLFELEADQEAAALRQAEELLAAAQAQLADLGTGKRSTEIEVIQAQLDQAKAEAARSASQLERDQAQFEAGGISRAELEASQAAQAVDAARLRGLAGQVQVAELSARPDQIRAQDAQVAAAKAALDQARWRLDQKGVSATQSALVVDTLYREGEWVPAGAPVVRLLPPGHLKVRFFVPEPALASLRVGQELALRCDGCASSIPATVSYVATQAEFTPPVIYSNEGRAKLVFMIEARPRDESGVLHPGQPVEILVP